jgi:hypothetical protein
MFLVVEAQHTRTFLPQLRLPLLHRRHHHIAHSSGGESVQPRTDALDGDDVEISRTRVVSAGHDGSAGKKNVSPVILCIYSLCPSAASQPASRTTSCEINRVRGKMDFKAILKGCNTYTGRPRVIFNLLPEAPPRLGRRRSLFLHDHG